MKKKISVLLALVVAIGLLSACGKKEEEVVPTIQPIEAEPIPEDTPEPEPVAEEEPEVDEEVPEHSYRSELTNEWIDEALEDQRPIAVMVDNELTALPHFGINDADVVYEIMNSTKNDRITRFMVIMKDWEKITQLGSIRSARPTNFMLAAEWNAIVCHDGGPFYIDEWVARDYTNNLSGGFARIPNGKATEFTEYITADTFKNSKGKTYDGLKQRIASAKYDTTYNKHYPGTHFTFAKNNGILENRDDATNAETVILPFTHNQSTLKYNSDTKTYDYYEYGKAHLDGATNEQLTFTNVILQDTTFSKLDDNGYLIYNAIDSSGRDGYYITEGKAIKITWKKPSETAVTKFYDKKTGEEIEINTGKTYISLIPSDTWNNVVVK